MEDDILISSLFQNLTYWPLCRKAIKCYDDVPPAPYYSNLVTETVAPIKEYDNVIYTCYNSSLKLPNKAQNFKVRIRA